MEQGELIEAYHEWLAAGDPQAEWEQLRAGMEAQTLRFGARYVCTTLRPMLLPRARFEAVRRDSERFYRALGWLYGRLMGDGALRQRIGLSDVEEAAIQLEPGFAAPDGIGRLDGFLDAAGTLRFVEFNADSPGGLAFGHALGELFLTLPTMRRLATRHPVAPFPAMAHILATLLAHYRAWGGRAERPTIAIVDWEGLGTAAEFVLCRNHFERAGFPAIITHPGALALRGGQLWDEQSGRAIQIVYKRVLVGELLARLGLDNVLTEAMRARAACVVNSYRAQLLFKKAVLALLSELADGGQLPAPHAATVRRHLPWTRLVRDVADTVEGRRVALPRFIAEAQERLVLKPNSDYGGAGVLLGWETDAATWQAAIAAALANAEPTIVQARIPVAAEPFPFWHEGALHIEPRFLDLDPYTFGRDSVQGAGVRLGSGGLLNVTAGGGSAVPLILVG